MAHEQRYYPSAEDAAMEGFPRSQVTVVGTCHERGAAVVLLRTNDRSPHELYQEICIEGASGWYDGGGSNGYGWTLFDEDRTVLTYWGETDARGSVRVRYQGEVQEVPVVEGCFLFCKWDVDEDDWSIPRLEG